MRMGHERLPRLVFQLQPVGKRGKGSSGKMWISGAKAAVSNRDLIINDTQNRVFWRGLQGTIFQWKNT